MGVTASSIASSSKTNGPVQVWRRPEESMSKGPFPACGHIPGDRSVSWAKETHHASTDEEPRHDHPRRHAGAARPEERHRGTRGAPGHDGPGRASREPD